MSDRAVIRSTPYEAQVKAQVVLTRFQTSSIVRSSQYRKSSIHHPIETTVQRATLFIFEEKASSKNTDSQQVLHYIYPLIIVLYFFLATTFSVCTLQKPSKGKRIGKLRVVALIAVLVSVLSYIGQGIAYISRELAQMVGTTTHDN